MKPTIKYSYSISIGYFDFGIRDGLKWWVREVNSSLGRYAWGVTLPDGRGDGGWTDTIEDAQDAAKARIAKEVKGDGTA